MSNRATTAAKGRPKKSYARGKSRKEDPEAMILWMPDETFCEEMSEWVDSPEGQLWLDMSDTGAIQSDALTLRLFVIRLVGSDLRAGRFCRTWPNRPPNRRTGA